LAYAEERMTREVLYELEAAVLSLPKDERARLAERLIASLDDDPDLEAAWAAEIRHRLDAIDRGEIEMIPAEDVIAEARRRLAK
jgi:putative addiction module component (TIGR02574 family)